MSWQNGVIPLLHMDRVWLLSQPSCVTAYQTYHILHYYSITYLYCEHQAYLLCRCLGRLPRLFRGDLFRRRLQHFARATIRSSNSPLLAWIESHVSKCVRRQITRTKELSLTVSTPVTTLTEMNLCISSSTITKSPWTVKLSWQHSYISDLCNLCIGIPRIYRPPTVKNILRTPKIFKLKFTDIFKDRWTPTCYYWL